MYIGVHFIERETIELCFPTSLTLRSSDTVPRVVATPTIRLFCCLFLTVILLLSGVKCAGYLTCDPGKGSFSTHQGHNPQAENLLRPWPGRVLILGTDQEPKLAGGKEAWEINLARQLSLAGGSGDGTGGQRTPRGWLLSPALIMMQRCTPALKWSPHLIIPHRSIVTVFQPPNMCNVYMSHVRKI